MSCWSLFTRTRWQRCAAACVAQLLLQLRLRARVARQHPHLSRRQLSGCVECCLLLYSRPALLLLQCLLNLACPQGLLLCPACLIQPGALMLSVCLYTLCCPCSPTLPLLLAHIRAPPSPLLAHPVLLPTPCHVCHITPVSLQAAQRAAPASSLMDEIRATQRETA